MLRDKLKGSDVTSSLECDITAWNEAAPNGRSSLLRDRNDSFCDATRQMQKFSRTFFAGTRQRPFARSSSYQDSFFSSSKVRGRYQGTCR